LALLIFQEIPNGMTLVGSCLLLAGIVWASLPARKPS
jgi:drug/metabolite transporter (DMT)-like permease